MNNSLKTELWKQFGAAIDMFENAIQKCPDSLWNDGKNFWYIAYHTLFFLDYYLTENAEKFAPPPPFTLSELEYGVMPDRIYTKEELISYTHHCREKGRRLIGLFTPEKMQSLWADDSRSYPMFEMQLYNMRHVMHHTGQLNMMLGNIDHDLPIWVSKTKHPL